MGSRPCRNGSRSGEKTSRLTGAPHLAPHPNLDATFMDRARWAGDGNNWRMTAVNPATLEQVGKWSGRLGVVGTAVGAGTSAMGQWQADEGKGFSASERVARAGTRTGATTAGGVAGAWAGGQVGASVGAVGGPAGALVGGLVGGAVGGIVGSGVGEEVADHVVEPVGRFVGNVGDGISSFGDWLTS